MSLNLYRYHSDSESLVGHDQKESIVLGIFDEGFVYLPEKKIFVLFASKNLGDIMEFMRHKLGKSAYKIMVGLDYLGYGGTGTPAKRVVEDTFSDYFRRYPEEKNKVVEYLKSKYGYDGNKDMFGFIYEREVEELLRAFYRAYEVGEEYGSEMQMISDFKKAVQELPNLVSDGNSVLFAEKYYVVISKNELLDYLEINGLDLDDAIATNTNSMDTHPFEFVVEDIADKMRESFDFEEPDGGWYGFSPFSAYDQLKRELGEILG